MKEKKEPESSSPISSFSGWFQQFQDNQRMERLKHCLQLDKILKTCRGKANKNNRCHQNQPDLSSSSSVAAGTNVDIEGCSQGLRMMKYFGWRGILLPDDDDENSKNHNAVNDYHGQRRHQTEKVHERIKSTCSREEHSVWACRAVATGCGQELSELRRCFDNEGPFNVLTAPVGGYEQSKKTNMPVLPCHDLQVVLGDCVHKSGRDLYERRKKIRQQQ